MAGFGEGGGSRNYATGIETEAGCTVEFQNENVISTRGDRRADSLHSARMAGLDLVHDSLRNISMFSRSNDPSELIRYDPSWSACIRNIKIQPPVIGTREKSGRRAVDIEYSPYNLPETPFSTKEISNPLFTLYTPNMSGVFRANRGIRGLAENTRVSRKTRA